MQTLFTVLTGIVTLIGVSIPVYFKWRKFKNESSKDIGIAPDAVDIESIRDRLRKRYRTGGEEVDEKE